MGMIGVDCGATSLRAGLVEVGGGPMIGDVLEVPTPQEVGDLAGTIAGLCGRLAPADAIGVGVAGLVDHDRGVVVWMPRRVGSAAVGERLAEMTGVPVAIDNDANVAGLAESTAGAGSGHRMVLMITLGTGIGGSLVIDGRVERGRGFLGEVGHLPMDPAGPSCACGLSGCWETLASGTALDRAARRLAAEDPSGAVAAAGADAPTGRHLVAAARQGDQAAGEAVLEVATWLGRGLAGLVGALDPDVIVIGGGVGALGEMLLEPARRVMGDSVSGSAYRAVTPVVAARFGEQAGLVGAAMMAEAGTARA